MSIFRGILSNPLATSQGIIRRAMKKNFKWPNEAAVLEKLQEEIKELQAALKNGDKKNQQEELGDIIFTVVCLSEQMNLSAEKILAQANQKFNRRFAKMTRLIARDKKSMTAMSPQQLEEYWQKIKH
ncbi:MAG: MazG nucleotide pyrophosphohydrolase domain-containing protein [Hydrotalea sp.]|nr:MazG nucleotide pyrophosphohydrolase domain-containing protein [Hydrotalea sp.]